jgi:ketosteroid isomerase-like protein
MKSILGILLLLLCFSCSQNNIKKIEQAKKEIVATERDFALMAKEKGVAEAFYYYADDSAKINRYTKLLSGRKEIKIHYENWPYKKVQLLWEPDFVDVAASCDLGYTYGKYTFIATDTTGKEINSKGFFHTVWKKQKNGDWKFVWD